MKTDALLVYDGDCGFCLKSLAWLRRRVGTWPEAVPWQEADLVRLGLTERECRRAIQWIDGGDHPHQGVLAFAALLKYQGGGWARTAGSVLASVPVRWIAQGVYRVVARNRHRLPGATAACSIADRAVMSRRMEPPTPDRRPVRSRRLS
ncbi:thiol-disulfide oxidoreductase DCC family protein [Planomonospora algeriensis]